MRSGASPTDRRRTDAVGTGERAERFLFVSDFHLNEDGFGELGAEAHRVAASDAFAGFVQKLCAEAEASETRLHLVLLGDTLDLLEPQLTGRPSTAPSVACRLRRIARANQRVFETLAAAMAAGIDLHVVPGNHDMELSLPDVQRLFRAEVERYAPGASGALTFHRWMFFVSGCVYAEHGQQHHDLNAFASALDPSSVGDPDLLDHPIGGYLDAALREWKRTSAPRSAARHHPLGTWGVLALALARGARGYARQQVAVGRRRWTGGHASRAASLGRFADDIGLSRESVRAIDDICRRGIGAVAVRALRLGVSIVRARWPAGVNGGPSVRPQGYSPEYLHAAGASIDQILHRRGEDVPFLVFGHSHVLERSPLHRPGSGGAAIFGTGTWTLSGPKGADLPSRAGLFPSVEVGRDEHGVVSAVASVWNARANRREVVA